MVVYGHTPVPQPDWLNRTINIDTGCVFGGNLTALRYPEKELDSVAARETYAQPVKPLAAVADSEPSLTSQQVHDDLLDIDDVIGKRIVTTRLHHNVTIREENALAALEVMSRFAANPKWLIYLPPTMSPTETTEKPGLLEHPARPLPTSGARASLAWCARKSTWVRAPSWSCAEVKMPLDDVSVSSGKALGFATHEQDGDSSMTERSKRNFSKRYGEPWTLQDSGSSLRRIGFVSTRN
jgi:hypothetical protein